jgi:hypothetical protein
MQLDNLNSIFRRHPRKIAQKKAGLAPRFLVGPLSV